MKTCYELLGVRADASTAEIHESFKRLARPYDALTWPHGRGGFFGLKKRIPRLLDQLDLRPAHQPALL